MLDPPEGILVKLLKGFLETCEDYQQAQTNIDHLQEHKLQLLQRISDYAAAARVLDVDLIDIVRKQKPEAAVFLESSPAAVVTSGRLQRNTVKEMVLEAVKEVYPNPIRASDIRRQLVRRGHHIHEKTVGMTLYRWAEEKQVRRVGFDWFYVPPREDFGSKPASALCAA